MRVSAEELMLRCRQGDVSAYELLVSRDKEGSLNFCCRMLCDCHREEDVTQEVFARVFGPAEHYEARARFSDGPTSHRANP